jgi:hypothetical protein
MLTAIIGVYATIPWLSNKAFQNTADDFFVSRVFVTISYLKVDMLISPVLESSKVSFLQIA